MSTSQTKGRVSVAAVVVLENGRTLEHGTLYNQMFDANLYSPDGKPLLGALRFFNRLGTLPVPYAYFVNAQVRDLILKEDSR